MIVKAKLLMHGDNNDGKPYRFLVMKTAYEIGIKGNVRILDNNTIQIIAESDEVLIQKFISLLNRKINNLTTKIHETDDHNLCGYSEFNF